MIERLFPEERNFGGEKRGETEQEIQRIKEALSEKMDMQGKRLLEQLSDACIRSSNLEIRDAFMQGLYDGMELMMRYYQARPP